MQQNQLISSWWRASLTHSDGVEVVVGDDGDVVSGEVPASLSSPLRPIIEDMGFDPPIPPNIPVSPDRGLLPPPAPLAIEVNMDNGLLPPPAPPAIDVRADRGFCPPPIPLAIDDNWDMGLLPADPPPIPPSIRRIVGRIRVSMTWTRGVFRTDSGSRIKNSEMGPAIISACDPLPPDMLLMPLNPGNPLPPPIPCPMPPPDCMP